MQAYCMKCRAKREMKDAKSITMKNGKPATQGICPTCGTYPLSRWLTILHGYALSILHFSFGTAFHTVCLHGFTSLFIMNNKLFL